MFRLETSHFIDEHPDLVWRVLTDFDSYPRWNPLIVSVEGDVFPGAKPKLRVGAPDGSGRTFSFRAHISHCEPEKRLAWRGGVPGILTGFHFFELTPEKNGTRLKHGEAFSGLFPFLAGKKRMEALRPAYEAFNRALEAEVSLRMRTIA